MNYLQHFGNTLSQAQLQAAKNTKTFGFIYAIGSSFFSVYLEDSQLSMKLDEQNGDYSLGDELLGTKRKWMPYQFR